ncbi:MAG: bifunctional riboflavin kinase/FAD synthetase [Lachnospiraceae bacterium]
MMKIIKEITEYDGACCAITLGKFDGIHRGHQQLLHKVFDAKKQGLRAVVFTFDRSPSQLFSGEPFTALFTEREKQEYLRQLGMDTYILYPFTKETAAMEPEQFIKEILVDTLHAKKIVVGTDYHFGKQRKGDAEMLARFAGEYGYEFEAVEKLRYQGEIISSTRIREAVREGRMEEAEVMLGRPYSFSGTIEHGRGLGHTLGFPTINLKLSEEKILPPYGVYCSETWIDGVKYFGISNIGCKPTVQKEKQYGIETHLFDCDENLYGKDAVVQLLHHTRKEVQFHSVEELKLQLEKDVQDGRSFAESRAQAEK